MLSRKTVRSSLRPVSYLIWLASAECWAVTTTPPNVERGDLLLKTRAGSLAGTTNATTMRMLESSRRAGGLLHQTALIEAQNKTLRSA